MKERSGRPLGEVLGRIGAELSDAAGSVDDLHAIVEAAIDAGGATDSLLRRAQTIDILQQHLRALAQFLDDLSGSISPGCRIESAEAMRNVKLSRLRERLGEMCGEDGRENYGAGDLDMFQAPPER
jgi:hypothetical protein